MAQNFLASHGIDLDKELDRIQTYKQPGVPNRSYQRSSTLDESASSISSHPLGLISHVSLPNTLPGQTFDVLISGPNISDIQPHDATRMPPEATHTISGCGALLVPSLCHPHVHIDKAYLLSYPRYSDSQIQDGTFSEAMTMTNIAKEQFTTEDLLERGQRLVDESVEAGVTHMRAFVEVDAVVELKCLEAGIALKAKAEAEGRMAVQLCAFAQLPLFSDAKTEAWSKSGTRYDVDGSGIRRLMREAAAMGAVEVLGSTPYVESDREAMERNVEWMVDLSIEYGKHLDFHLDYNLDPEIEPLVWHVIRALKSKDWESKMKDKTVVLGHCTRLSLFKDAEWQKLKAEIGNLPISFVGLPTSDLFMMRTPERTRGTLDVPRLIKDHGINACIGINNIGNAFTPQGSCDPLSLACNGVAVYSAGAQSDAALLYECISTRARKAIGFERAGGEQASRVGVDSGVLKGDRADLILFAKGDESWRTRRSVSEAVYLYDHCKGRRSCLNGKLTS